MAHYTKFIGLDVHKNNIAVAIADSRSSEVRFYGNIPNTLDGIVKLAKQFSEDGAKLSFVYEAGPCGYTVHRKLLDAGYECRVVAPSLIPKKAGDRVKTDRRDAQTLARLHRAGELTSVWVPGPEQEAMRDLSRLREDLKTHERHVKQQISAFFLRNGRFFPEKSRWTAKHYAWIDSQRFDQPLQQVVLQGYCDCHRRNASGRGAGPNAGSPQRTARAASEETGEKAQERPSRARGPWDAKSESEKWLASFREVARIQALLPGTRLVSVRDRESDFHELFVLAVKNRKTTDEVPVWESLKDRPEAGTMTVEFPRKGGRPGRTARLSVRTTSVGIAAPAQGKSRGAPPVRLQAVVVTETEAPEGIDPLEWKLLTTEPVDSLEKAAEVVGWYARRWGIEVFHRTLKSGCRIEDRQLGNDHRLEACLAIDMVVAWRLFHLTKLGREIPDAPCTVFFEEAEWKALCIFHSKNPEPPKTPPTMRETIRMVTKMGGFLGRKGDGEPGTEVLWKGLQELVRIAEFWEILEKMNRAGPTSPVPKRRRYG